MGFIENFKIKRAAKKAKAVYQLELNEWEQENRVLNAALDIFTTASKGDEPDDSSLVQKKGELVSIQELIDAQNSDLFDVLEFVKYALKPITRTKRANTSRSIMEEGLEAKQLEFVDFLVSQYIESGVGELEESKLETLLEIKYSDVFSAVQTLGKGDVSKVRKLFLDFQKNLYLPHKEYQRVS